jgi:hypothetical protein
MNLSLVLSISLSPLSSSARRCGVKRGGATRPRQGGGWVDVGRRARRATAALGDATRDCSGVMR